MLFSLYPQAAAVETVLDSDVSAQAEGLCDHHPQHTDECGYTEGAACAFVCEVCSQTDAPADSSKPQESVDAETVATAPSNAMSDTLTTSDTLVATSSVSWEVSSSTLIISGTGDMTNYTYGGEAPWFSDASSITDILINSGVTSIGDYAFLGFTNLKSVTIPAGVTYIGAEAFRNCSALTSVVLPSSVTAIGRYAFGLCSSLQSVTFNSNPAPILGDDAFNNCTSLNTIRVPINPDGYGGSGWPQNPTYIDGYNYTYYTVAVRANNGTAATEFGPLFRPGTVVNLTATPNQGYEFDRWNVLSGSVTNADLISNSFTMPTGSVTIEAIFTALPLPPAPTLNGSAGANSISINTVAGQRYAITTTSTAPSPTDGVWTTGTGSPHTFYGLNSMIVTPSLTPGTRYYIWTYIPGSGTTGNSSASSLTVYTAPRITTTSLHNAIVSQPYSATLEAESTETVTWSISSGTLPGGLTLSGNTISGTPSATTIGPQSITVTATVGSGSSSTSSSQTLTIMVRDTPLPTPTGLAWDSARPATATWNAVANTSGYTVQLYKDGVVEGNPVSINSGNTTSHTFSITEAGSYTFTVIAIAAPGVNNADSLESARSAALNYYAVSFDTSGGSVVPSQVIIDGGTVSEPPQPSRSGYQFDGWYEDSNRTNPWTFAEDTVSQNMTLYAKWINTDAGIVSVIIFDETSNNGKAGLINGTNIDVTLPYGSTLPTSADAHSRITIFPAPGATVTAGPTDIGAGAIWTFTITAEDGTTTRDYTIYVSVASDLIGENEADVNAAKSAVERFAWTVPYTTANTEQTVKTWIEQQLDSFAVISQNEVNYAVTMTGFTAADVNQSGANGSFAFTVVLSKGSNTGSATDDTYAEATVTVTNGVITTNQSGGGSGGGGGIGGGGGGIGGNDDQPTYPPTIEDTEGGNTDVSPSNPKPGDTVIITPKPDGDNTVDEIIVTDQNGNRIPVIDNGDGTWSFTQPDGSVTIQVIYSEWNNPFVDVAESDWFYYDVMYAHQNGIVAGTTPTTFEPNSPITRAQTATIFYRTNGSPAVSGNSPFTDVENTPGTVWYYNAVLWAQQVGVVSGHGNGIFRPNDNITREQLAVIFYNYARHMGYDVSVTDNLSGFTDAGNVADWAIDAMRWAVVNGIIGGLGNGILAPQGTATRAQVVAMLHRLLTE